MSPNTEVWGLNSFVNTPGTLLAGTHGGGGKFLVLMPPVWAGVKPTVSDTPPQKSQRITATNGTWTGTPTIEFTYQWQDCTVTCTDIPDATDASLVVPAQNRKYRVVVTAQNDFPTGPSAPDVQGERHHLRLRPRRPTRCPATSAAPTPARSSSRRPVSRSPVSS